MMSWADHELVSISALQHYAYCKRQCALIHLEQTFGENLYTLRGQRLHENVDIPSEALREGVQIGRALPLWSKAAKGG
jgi:CRISPR-associated exonuclease Cas4